MLSRHSQSGTHFVARPRDMTALSKYTPTNKNVMNEKWNEMENEKMEKEMDRRKKKWKNEKKESYFPEAAK